MRHFVWLQAALLVSAFLLGGCAQQAGKHSHVVIPRKRLNIWSHSPITTVRVDGVDTGQKGFVEVAIQDKNAVVVLHNGSTIDVSNQVTINGVTVPAGTLNVLVGLKGDVALNSYIRTFK